MAEPPATSPPPWRRPALRRAALLLLALALAGAVLAWRARPPQVAVVTVQQRPLQRTLDFTARVAMPQRVELGSTVTGRVADVKVGEGDAVAAGALLLTLEADEARATLAQAQAAERQAAARRQAQRAVSEPTAQAQTAQAEATLRSAEREFERTQDLVKQGFLSPARLDEARRGLEVARAQVEAARAQARAQRPEGAEAASAQAAWDNAAAAVALAQARLAQTSLRAPAAGRVLLRQVEPGQIVQPGRALLTLAVDGATELVAQVDERFLGQLQAGQAARVVADAFPQQPFGARVARLAPAVDAQRGAVEVKLELQGARPDFLREDMTLSVQVVTGERERALVLPTQALAPGAAADRGQVLVAHQGRSAWREVGLGLRTLGQVEITRGLQPGEAVLLDPSLGEGQRLRPQAVDGQAAAARGEGGGFPMSSFGR